MNAIRQAARLAGLVLAIFVILPLGQSDARSGYKADAKQICLQNCRADCTKNHSDVEANLRKCRTSCNNECAH